MNQLRGEIKFSRKTDERGGEYYEDEDMQSKKKNSIKAKQFEKNIQMQFFWPILQFLFKLE